MDRQRRVLNPAEKSYVLTGAQRRQRSDLAFVGAVYRVLDTPAGYVRVRGFEPLQQEQMVMQFVERSIRRPGQ